jgi:hypothetical protein
MKQIKIDGVLYNYTIDESGNVYNKKGKIMKPGLHNGYLVYRLRLNGSYKNLSQHRILAYAFIPTVQGLNFVRHLNDIKDDNRLENLAWGDYKSNVDDAHKNNRIKKGSNRYGSKLTEKDVDYIRTNSQKTGKELSNIYNVSEALISNIKSGKKWTHVKK